LIKYLNKLFRSPTSQKMSESCRKLRHRLNNFSQMPRKIVGGSLRELDFLGEPRN
jgi:hypothetical protein